MTTQEETGGADTAVSKTDTAADTADDNPKVAASPSRSAAFEQQLSEGGVRFTLMSPNTLEANTLTIKSEGLSKRNPSFTKDIGTQQVYRAALADLNQDSYPEVYIFTRTLEEPPKGEVYVYASYRNRSFGEAYVADESVLNQRSETYRGGDVFELQENALIRRFPLYINGRASADTSTLTYKLKMGEASYRLEVAPK